MSYNEECKKCCEFEDGPQNCHLAILNRYQNICPCTFCLVKSMCNTSCDLYKDFEIVMEAKGMIV